ncbi:related to Rossmann fold nucleotide-binding protein [Fusarium torulosum]|uniref:Related to Rossmann fold nucleotide-binding protein n=1 Tax=Fusarium torulosum TaxID=33205 RepID=A0AAE8LZ38_9HYPO|nr:related to Rossmann fold nucleotide-binding protein [Fusarium torulosum]
MPAGKKFMIAEILADGPVSGFIGLGGSFGTMEETFEMTSWIQPGIHTRGIVLLNIEGCWDGIIQSGKKCLLAVAESAKGSTKALREYQVSSTIFQLQ